MCGNLQVSYKVIISQLISVTWMQVPPKIILAWHDWEPKKITWHEGVTNTGLSDQNKCLSTELYALLTDILKIYQINYRKASVLLMYHVSQSCQCTSTQALTASNQVRGHTMKGYGFKCAQMWHRVRLAAFGQKSWWLNLRRESCVD